MLNHRSLIEITLGFSDQHLFNHLENFHGLLFLLYPMRSMGESIGIGLAASSPSKGPQAKTAEHMDSIKVTYCSIQLG